MSAATGPQEQVCYCLGQRTNDMLQCRKCRQMFHVTCLKSGIPQRLPQGDIFFNMVCAACASPGEELVSRQNVSWLQVLQLVMYNLSMGEAVGRNGFFQWRDNICDYILKYWNVLFVDRNRTSAWHNTVAGVLSVNTPSVFRSGAQELNEQGWWALQEIKPPEFKLETPSMKKSVSSRKRKYGREGTDTSNKRMRTDGDVDSLMGTSAPPSAACSEPGSAIGSPMIVDKSHIDFPRLASLRLMSMGSTPVASSVPSPSCDGVSTALLPRQPIASKDSLVPMKPYQERHLLQLLSVQYASAVRGCAKARRLAAKLRLRQMKRDNGLPLLDIDRAVVCAKRIFVTAEDLLPSELAIAYSLQCDRRNVGLADTPPQTPNLPSRSAGLEEQLLDRFHTVLPTSVCLNENSPVPFSYRLSGCPDIIEKEGFVSAYTARTLKPFIRRDFETRPPKLRLLQDIIQHPFRNVVGYKPPTPYPIDYCYVRPHHIPAVNALCQQFFWPGVDLTECLQYPDFSVVVQYRKLVVGCAFMTPDVKVNETYISFLVVHPEWRQSGIATFMIYHLIQTCMGKDVTLHVSASNSAMLLYQKFGFKPEEFILDFYDRYFPSYCTDSRHAFFLRLRR